MDELEFKADDYVEVLSGYNKGFRGTITKKLHNGFFAIIGGLATIFQKPDNLKLLKKEE